MKQELQKFQLVMALAATAFTGNSAIAAVTLSNGSFETTGTQYITGIGGLNEATGWTNFSSTSIQASSALAVNPPNDEFTSGAGNATGSRYLRLVADGTNVGVTGQYLGVMTAGETYRIRADIFGGPSVGATYGATISLVDLLNPNPSVTYASQTVGGVANTAFTADAFDFSYTATALDDGNALVLLLRAPAVGVGQATRGGLDNIRLTVVPEPSTALLGGLGLVALLRRRR